VKNATKFQHKCLAWSPLVSTNLTLKAQITDVIRVPTQWRKKAAVKCPSLCKLLSYYNISQCISITQGIQLLAQTSIKYTYINNTVQIYTAPPSLPLFLVFINETVQQNNLAENISWHRMYGL